MALRTASLVLDRMQQNQTQAHTAAVAKPRNQNSSIWPIELLSHGIVTCFIANGASGGGGVFGGAGGGGGGGEGGAMRDRISALTVGCGQSK